VIAVIETNYKTRLPEILKITTSPGEKRMPKTTQQKIRTGLRPGPARWPGLAIAAVILAISFGITAWPAAARAQETESGVVAEAEALAREMAEVAQEADATARDEALRYAYALGTGGWGLPAEGTQVPQDIRIMQRIVQTALGEVEAPELPEAMKESGDLPDMPPGAFVYTPGDAEAAVVFRELAGRGWSIGGRDVTGFYMDGYGYLFTVKWQVSPRGGHLLFGDRAAERYMELGVLADEARRAAGERAAEEAEARAASEAERTLRLERERQHELQEAWEAWADEYRDRLAEALREVVALYGSTLKRATPDEAITFIADFGGGEDETVTVSTRRGQLTGASRAENLAAVQMSRGTTGVSDTLRTELKIMSEIIDSSLEVEGTGDTWTYAVGLGEARYFSGDSSYQYVPGYGVLFRKGARLNIATGLIRRATRERGSAGVNVETLREQLEQGTEEQRQAYTEHLADLKEKTSAVLATYGPTLTELNDSDWVGVFYNVGSAAGLLEGGISNFLVQATMADVRQAGAQADGATWLLSRLVTNEKQE
jgi:hypothetical protein